MLRARVRRPLFVTERDINRRAPRDLSRGIVDGGGCGFFSLSGLNGLDVCVGVLEKDGWLMGVRRRCGLGFVNLLTADGARMG